jgi:hypothetical protein
LSEAAPQERLAWPIEPEALRVPGALGGVTSQPSVDAVRLARGEAFPAASRASTSRFELVPHVMPVNVKVVEVEVPACTPLR